MALSHLPPGNAGQNAPAIAAPWGLNVDLHCHSTVSDGTQTPTAVVERAHRNGVQLLALTDHDELGGIAEASARAAQLGLPFVPGVEISVTWAGETVHIVGLGIDPSNAALRAGLDETRSGRTQRAREMALSFERAGIPDTFDGALRHVANPNLISRSHFARHLVDVGVCSNTSQVFQRFMMPGKPGYVPQTWARLDEALAWILGAGGVAVLAHPGRYRLDETALWELARAFVDAGGGGIEVLSGSQGLDAAERFAQWSLKLGLRASRASDFHDPRESRFDLGTLPALSRALRPVWEDWPQTHGMQPTLRA